MVKKCYAGQDNYAKCIRQKYQLYTIISKNQKYYLPTHFTLNVSIRQLILI